MENWISLSQTAGTGNATITVTATSYTELMQRATSLTVSTRTKSAAVNIFQRTDDSFIIRPNSLIFNHIGGSANTMNLIITAPSSWTVTSKPEWITLDYSSGSSSMTITATADPNTSSERTGSMVFVSNGMERTVAVKQLQFVPSSASTNSETTVVPTAGGDGDNGVTSNVGWYATVSDSWLSVSPSSGNSGYTEIEITATPNPSYISGRTGYVYIYSIFDELLATITVTQAVKQAPQADCTHLYYVSDTPIIPVSTWENIDSHSYDTSTGLGCYTFKRCEDTIPAKGMADMQYVDTSHLKSVSLPPTIKRIEDYAFYNRWIMDVTIPDSVEFIGEFAFYHVGYYERIYGGWGGGVTMPSTNSELTYIGTEAFLGAHFTSSTLDLPEGLVFIGGCAFQYSDVTSVRFKKYCKYIAGASFKNCSGLTSLYFYEPECPTMGYASTGSSSGWTFEEVATSGVVHAPAGTDYSNIFNYGETGGGLPSGWTIQYDLQRETLPAFYVLPSSDISYDTLYANRRFLYCSDNNYTITAPSWITLNAGWPRNFMTLEIAINNGEPRTDTVTISGTSGSQSFDVSQYGAALGPVVGSWSPTSALVELRISSGSTGNTYSIPIGYGDYAQIYVENPISDWCSYSLNRSYVTSGQNVSITFTALSFNSSTYPRQGNVKVYFYDSNLNRVDFTVVVKQRGTGNG